MFALFKSVWRARELVLILVGRNLKIRYKSSALGFFWSLLGPLCMIGIYATFAGILKWNDGRANYLQFLIVGLLAWQFLSMCLNDSLHAVMGNANLVKKTAFPRAVLPAATVIANAVNFLLTLAVLLVYLLVFHRSFGNPAWLAVALVHHVALCLGIAMLVSASNVFFRDTEHIVGVLSLAWFFLSPIFYPISMQLDRIPDALAPLPFLNPVVGLVGLYRQAFIGETLPSLPLLLLSLGVCWGFMFLGAAVFSRAQRRFGDVL